MALMPDDKLLGEKVQCYISDDSDDEGDGTGFVRMTNTATAQHNPEMPQTGPKGVLADYKEFQKTGEMRGPLPKDASHNPSDDSDFNFSDEEEIFSSYRDTRFAQFNEECQRNETMLESQRDSARRFEYKKLIWSENVAELDRKNYVKHVEASGHVITLLYDAFDEHSIVTNKAINQLAKELPHVKFCRAEHKVILDSCSDLLSSFQNHPFPYYNCPFGLPLDSFWTLLGLLLDSFWTPFGLFLDFFMTVSRLSIFE